MSNYHCRKFCGKDADFICQSCSLKETSAERIIEELISRNLANAQETVENGKRRVQGYYIWKQEVLEYDKKQKK